MINIYELCEKKFSGNAVEGAVREIESFFVARQFLEDYLKRVQNASSSLFSAMNSIKDAMLREMGRQKIGLHCREMWICALEDFFVTKDVTMDLPIRLKKPASAPENQPEKAAEDKNQ